MPWHATSKRDIARAERMAQGAKQPREATPVARSDAGMEKKAPAKGARPRASEKPVASPRPGTLAWAVQEGWQLQTRGDGLVQAWKPSGEATPWLPAGPDTTQATFYRPALDAAAAMERA